MCLAEVVVNVVLRRLGGIVYRCVDLGCSNFKRAEENRRMIANKENIIAYLIAESAVAGTPKNEPLPSWIPQENQMQGFRGTIQEELATTLTEEEQNV